jgi:hypothetical protein
MRPIGLDFFATRSTPVMRATRVLLRMHGTVTVPMQPNATEQHKRHQRIAISENGDLHEHNSAPQKTLSCANNKENRTTQR